MWLRAMVACFFLNGISPFGLRILAGWGLGDQFIPVYLFYWYLGGLVFIGAWSLFSGVKIGRMDILLGVLMSLASVCGQVSMGYALEHGVPGNVVYPIAQGSSIFIVAAGGVLIFKERVGIYGKAGIAVGLLAAVLLGVME